MSQESQDIFPAVRAGFYVDGFNLYHSINDLGENFLKWCNLRRLAEIVVPSQSEALAKVVYCTAYYPGSAGQRSRHERYVRALQLMKVDVVMGHYVYEDMDCKSCGREWEKPTEKQTDINLALSLFDDAYQDVIDHAYLLTADTDQAATAKFFAMRFPNKKLTTVSPPGRTHSQHILSHTPFKMALNRDHIERALFRATVQVDGHPLILRPSEYDPPANYVFWDDRAPKPKKLKKSAPV